MKNLLLLVCVLICTCFQQMVYAEDNSSLYIKVGEAQVKKSLLAFPPLQYSGNPAANPEYRTVGADLFQVIVNDLTVSGYFQFIDQKAFLGDVGKQSLLSAAQEDGGFKFDSWKTIGAEFLIRAAYSISGGQLTLETYTYQVPREKLIFAKKYKGPVSEVRRIAHTYCNDVLKELTGQTGMFLSKLVLGSDRAGGQAREIYTMDWDGYDMNKISNHKGISLSPAWSPDNKKIAYTSFVKHSKSKKTNADLFIYDPATANRWLVSYREGINSGVAFHPDNKNIYLTISQGNSPDIYQMTFDGTLVKKVTDGPRGAMNVEPAVSPDGKKIAFSSDRSGRPMIYVMNVDGSNPQRITIAGKYNSSPSWSPDGNKIAFAAQVDDHFDIFVMNADGTNMIKLTSAHKPNGKWADNEDPSFSPDGRFVIYTSNRTNKNQVYLISADGSNERRITSDNHNYFKPKWSKNFE